MGTSIVLNPRAKGYPYFAGDKALVVTRPDVEKFCSLYGDNNPIHFSLEASKERGHTGIVVPGLLLAAYVSGFVEETFPGSIAKELKCSWDKYAYADERLRIILGVSDEVIKERLKMKKTSLMYEVINIETGKTKLSGEARILVPF